MAQIRSFNNKESSVRTTQRNTGNIDYRKVIAAHRLKILYRIALFVLVSAAVAALFYVQYTNRVYTDYQIISSVTREEAQNAVSKNLGGSILTYSNDGASCMNTNGEQLWNQTYEMQNPMIDINQSVAAIADYNGRDIYIVDAQGVLGKVEAGLPIRSISVSETGMVAAVVDDSEITAIYLFSSAGDEVAYFKTTMEKSGYPIAVSVSPNGEIVAVSYLYVDSGLIMSNVAFYNFGQVGQNETDNYVSGYSYSDAVIPQISFMDEDNSFALADNRLVFYKGNQIPTSNQEVLLNEEIQSVYYDNNYVGLVYINLDGDTKYRMDVFSKVGKKILSQKFDMEYTEIYFNHESFIIYNESECEIYNLRGVKKFDGSFKEAVSALLPTSAMNKYVAVSQGKIEIMELK
ncbi:MAG: DUF5711 family protein [Lachnospiraceae bacterium]|nr:DUF5711 family protein [Lachnospiraceae bacterium]MDD3661413.1 DUF5711 family protein [Lachnospiraceae bacterium]